ncbi:MAG: hypothetical protein NZ899_02810 [Thermoguttaceae bacterium]|nr:hypothetical protein [Thermoguttaceae bacterium]MDW8079742.1 secretin N-terminal domain-containing protein [Thermoguttaceae bacterium]
MIASGKFGKLPHPRPCRVNLVGTALLLGPLLLASPEPGSAVLAQPSPTLGNLPSGRQQFHSFPLRHREATELAGPLREIISGFGGAQLVVDHEGNQFLVAAPEELIPVIAELISRLDQPRAAPLASKAEVQAYICPPDKVPAVVDQVRQAFAQEQGIRIAGDPTTGRIFVVAPASRIPEISKLVSLLGVVPESSGRSSDQRIWPEPGSGMPGHTGFPQPPPSTGAGMGVAAGSGMPDARVPADSPGPSQLPDEYVTAVIPRPRSAGLRPAFPPAEESESLFVEVSHLPVNQIREQLGLLLGARLGQVATPHPGRAELCFEDARGRRAELGFDHANKGVWIQGPRNLARQLASLVRALDRPMDGQTVVRVLPVGRIDPLKLKEALDAFRAGQASEGKTTVPAGATSPGDNSAGMAGPSQGRLGLVDQVAPLLGPAGASLLALEEASRQGHQDLEGGVVPTSYQEQVGPPAPSPQPVTAPGQPTREEGQLIPAVRGDVEVESLPDLDVLILRGRQRDVEELSRIIAELERLSALAEPQIEIYRLRHVNCLSLSRLISQVQAELLGNRQGRVSITPLVKPNALLLIGWGEALEATKRLIEKLDQPVSPHAELKIFPLKRANANVARTTIASAFVNRGGLSPDVQVIADTATNSLIVRASPSDMREVELLVNQLEGESQAVLQTRIFKLRFTLASDIANTLQSAISAAVGGLQRKSAILELVGIDREKQEVVRSGLLTDVQIVPNSQTNTLVITAPAESMELIAALIEQLDTPSAVAQIKVFRVFNADATALANLLRTLFPPQPTGAQLAGAEGETTLVPLRFSVDVRTNSIIATGSRGDLAIVEALLLRLDEEEVRQRINTVYRLKNAPAADVARSINDFLRTERQLQLAAPGVLSPFLQIESEVVVVPEPVSNALIISATPRFFPDIMELVEKLDELPPQVLIQALIVEVELASVDEFGAEFGLQDSVLFDRSVISTTLNPGFNFNNQPLGNAGSALSLSTSEKIGTQGLTHFSLGRSNSELGYGGFVFSASSENLSILLRALQDRRQLRVLSRPQIMTLDNQPAFIQVGKRVPRIVGTRFYAGTQFNAVELEPVGLILSVTPRISPDGMVVMQVDAEKSELGPESEGIPVSISGGEVIRSPSVNVTTAQTTVSAADGETIVIGGLITKYNTAGSRRIPYLADIPLVGRLFRMDNARERRSELLIILTPRVVRNPAEAERIKQEEAARIHFVLSDVLQIHGEVGLPAEDGLAGHLTETPVIFPTLTPRRIPAEARCLPQPTPHLAPPPTPAAKSQSEQQPSLEPPAQEGKPAHGPVEPQLN